MGEYLSLVLKNGLKIKDQEIKELLETTFKDYPNLLKELQVNNGKVTTKLGVCEEVFFTFEEMVNLHSFIKKYKAVFEYGKEHAYNCTPEQYLKARTSLYMGGFERYQQHSKTKKVLITKHVKQLEHGEVWQKYFKTVSRNGKTYYKKVAKSQTTGVYGNGNGKRVKCKNTGRQFKAFPSGFAWDCQTNKGRKLFNCPKCRRTFNQGEFKTPEFEGLSKELKV